MAPTTVRSLEIDPNNHVWLVAGAALWRMTATPDFTLAAAPALWLQAPAENRQGSVIVGSQGGFTESVMLAVYGLPTGVTAQVVPSQVTAGQRSTLTLQTTGDVALGVYPAIVIGSSTTIIHTTPLTVMLVAEVYAVNLPVVGK